jgi:hypothetical protein
MQRRELIAREQVPGEFIMPGLPSMIIYALAFIVCAETGVIAALVWRFVL